MIECKTYSVYRFDFPNGKIYIGMTKAVPVEGRWGKHGENYHALVGRAINKYGWDNVIKQILISGQSHYEACEVEKAMIKQFDTMNKQKGYNLTIGGDGATGYTPTLEHRKHISEALKGKKRNTAQIEADRQSGLRLVAEGRCGVVGKFKGHHHTEEAKQRIGLAARNPSDETREKLRNSSSGRKMSEETKKKLPQIQKGYHLSEKNLAGIRWAAAHHSEIRIEADKEAGIKRRMPVACLESKSLYAGGYWAGVGENLHEQSVARSCQQGVTIKGKTFVKYPRGTLIETILQEHIDWTFKDIQSRTPAKSLISTIV